MALCNYRSYLAFIHLAAFLIHLISALLASQYQLKYDDAEGIARPVDGLKLTLQHYELQYANQTATVNTTDGSAFLFPEGLRAVTLLVWNEGITAGFHAVAMFLWFLNSCQKAGPLGNCLDMSTKFRRWIEYTITASFIEGAIFLAQGVTDPFIHLFIWSLNFVLQGFGLLTELDLEKQRKCSSSAIMHNVLGYIVLAPPIWYAFYNNENGAKVDNALLWIFTVSYASFGIFQTLRFFLPFNVVKPDSSPIRKCLGRWNSEITFTLLSMTTKLLLTWYLIVDVNVSYRAATTDPNPAGSDTIEVWESTGRGLAIGLPLSAFVVLAVLNSIFGLGEFSEEEDIARAGSKYKNNFPMLQQLVQLENMAPEMRKRITEKINRSGRYESLSMTEKTLQEEENFVALNF